MATKSILKDINVKEKNFGRSLVNALENSKGKHSKDVQLSRTYSEITGEKIKQLFGNHK